MRPMAQREKSGVRRTGGAAGTEEIIPGRIRGKVARVHEEGKTGPSQ